MQAVRCDREWQARWDWYEHQLGDGTAVILDHDDWLRWLIERNRALPFAGQAVEVVRFEAVAVMFSDRVPVDL